MSEESKPAPEYVEVVSTDSRHRARLGALILLAVGIPTLIEEAESGYSLQVPSGKLARAARELALFAEENQDWPPPRLFGEQMTGGAHRPPTVLLLSGLLIFYVVSGPAELASEWFRRGAVDSAAVLQGGQWWRLFTALTLHADLVHLLGNLVFGGLVIHFLLRLYGVGLGLLLTICGGALANYANVLAHGAGHHSLGFSTAVFAAVGLLAGSQVDRQRCGGIILPLGAGLALLAMLGSEGRHTDLGAHLWGLAVGLGFGLLRRLLSRRARATSRGGEAISAWLQAALLVMAFLWLVGAWFLAWTAK